MKNAAQAKSPAKPLPNGVCKNINSGGGNSEVDAEDDSATGFEVAMSVAIEVYSSGEPAVVVTRFGSDSLVFPMTEISTVLRGAIERPSDKM